ncbi:MAG: hypothetical protein ACRDPJ_07255 [Nocardioidaceae bacterium]
MPEFHDSTVPAEAGALEVVRAETVVGEVVRAETGAVERIGDRHVSRHTVVKTGVHAAWAVPLVQMVVAAPALAASGPAALAITSTSASWQGPAPKINTSVTVTNSGGTVTAALAVIYQWTGLTPDVSDVAGWTASGSGTSTITLAAGQQLSPGALATLTPTFTVKPQQKGPTSFTVTATATGTSAGPVTVVVPAPPR